MELNKLSNLYVERNPRIRYINKKGNIVSLGSLYRYNFYKDLLVLKELIEKNIDLNTFFIELKLSYDNDRPVGRTLIMEVYISYTHYVSKPPSLIKDMLYLPTIQGYYSPLEGIIRCIEEFKKTEEKK